ncbi:MAG: hypothetical protein ACU826_06565 [Gammaproteobacteria bacterium]
MEKYILERYARTGEGKVIIDIAAAKIEDLYNDYDKSAPFVKKDLEQDLADYIVNSVDELGKEAFALKFSLEKAPDAETMSRLKISIRNYFLYLRDLEMRELKSMFRVSLILLVIGVAILTLSILLGQQLGEDQTVIGQVLTEGLTVAAWVSLWESLATFLINWKPHRRRIGLYERIARAPVLFS